VLLGRTDTEIFSSTITFPKKQNALVGIRYKVVKDVRIVIAKLIWDSREEEFFRASSNLCDC
jgi:hypothetical protein